MKKNLFFAAIAITALASCSSNDYVGDQSPQDLGGTNGAINFNMNTAAITRASGSAAAAALDNQFIVWGEKNESGGTAVSVPSVNSVFPNYQVNWVDHAQSTTSNSSGWEYVGYTHSSTSSTDDYKTNINPSLSEAQTIKYWDMSASNYVFTAVSALKNDIKTGKVQISKTLTGTDAYAKGYTITVAADASFDHLYFADRNEITTGYGTSPVTMNFRNLLSQIRVGFYETIPGYDVSAIKFYQSDGTTEFITTGESPASIFGATVDNLKPAANTLKVTYNAENRPVVSTSGARATTITLGQNFNTLTTSNVMAITSAQPTWETSGGTFTKVFPREGVTSDMTLKVKYTLYNSYSGETMDITGTAVVPGEYLQWKPNFKYSYIFKLTDDALTPITFDAVQVETETGSIEYITTVDNPSITTYQNGTQVSTSNEYVTGKPIYVVVGDGTSLEVGTSANLYTATVEDGFVEGITENTVANALANGTQDPTGTWTLTDGGGKHLVVTAAGGLTAFSSIESGDSPTGAELTINGAKFTPTAPTFVAQTPASNPHDEGFYERSGAGTDESPYVYTLTSDTSVDGGKTYYEKTVTSAGYYVFEYTDGESKKHYKVIKVVDKY